MRHGWLRHLIAGLEDDPHLQYKVHLWAVRIWLVNMLAVVCVFSLAQGLWLKVSVLYLVLISLYANLATDYGSMSASMAAFGGQALPVIPLDTAGATAHYQQQQVIHDLLEQNNTLTGKIEQATSLLDEIHRHVSALAPQAGEFPPGPPA